MRCGCAAILEACPQVRVVSSGTHETLEGFGPDEVDVAVVGVRPGMGDETSVVAVLAGRGLPVLVVLPPGLRGTTAIEAGALATVAGTHVTDDELTEAVLALGGHSSADLQAERASGDGSAPGESVLGRLSQREREVLAQVASGRTDREVGERLGISMRTVQSHLDRIREKTGRRRRAELTALAYELGLVIPHE
jgi:two-component system, NarL family, nitrate/nitrite response regulator NarL